MNLQQRTQARLAKLEAAHAQYKEAAAAREQTLAGIESELVELDELVDQKLVELDETKAELNQALRLLDAALSDSNWDGDDATEATQLLRSRGWRVGEEE